MEERGRMYTLPARAAEALRLENVRTMTMLLIPVIAIIVAAASYAAFILLQKPENDNQTNSFCCPNEARTLSVVVNTSVNPCDSFYNFVCINTIRYGLWPHWNAQISLRRDIATATNLRNNSAALYLSSLFRSCVATIWRERTLAIQLAETIAEMCGLGNPMKRDDVILYVLATNVRLEFHSAIYIQPSRDSKNVLNVGLRTFEESSPYYEKYKICLLAVVDFFSAKYGSQVTAQQVVRFGNFMEQKFQELFEGYGTNFDEKITPSWLLLEYWKTTALASGWTMLEDITKLHVRDIPMIILLMRTIFQKEYHEIGLIYLHSHSTTSAFLRLTQDIKRIPNNKVFDRCLDIVSELRNINDHLFTETLTSPDSERDMLLLYNVVAKAMANYILTRTSLQRDDRAYMLGRLHEQSFIVPSQRLLNITIPSIFNNFAWDYCQGLHYEFLAREIRKKSSYAAHIHHQIPLTHVDDKYIIISPGFFKYLSFNTSHHILLNMPSIGVQMAVTLWQMLLKVSPNLNKLGNMVSSFFRCFKDKYFHGRELGRLEKYGVARALAIDTVLGILQHAGWHDLKGAWSLWKISNSQFFYLRETFYRCPLRTNPTSEENVNVPLLYNSDFGVSFNCQHNSSMARTRVCFL